ncbi:hypothetical protein QJQ45_012048 [Haematococcus lacustris]|nr:hypothetical protein QJQ45_012048 [Haematococcus lacustris]
MPTMFLIVALGLSALASSALAADPGWQDGRSTWFDVQDNDLKTANCHFRWDQVKTGSYIAAFSDSNPLFAKSCGMCIEIRCQNAVFKDGYGQTMDRNRACKDPSKSIYLTIADACPCNYPNNHHSNKRWCCGDDSSRQHIDITQSAFAQLADTSVGVIGLQWRTVDCSRCSSVDHHQPEQPVSLPGAPQPQFDIEAELARVAQFQEQFRELDQALTALQPLPGPPAQPTSTPMRLFNRFAVLDLEYGVPKEQEVLEVQPYNLGAVLQEVQPMLMPVTGSQKRQRTQPPSTATPDLTPTTAATTSPAATSHSVVLRSMRNVARVLKQLSWRDRAAVISLLQEQGIIEEPTVPSSHILGAMVLDRMKTLNKTGTCGKAGGQRLSDMQAKANLARLVPPEVKEQRRVTAFAEASGMDRAAVAQAASENATALATDSTGRLLYFTERLDHRGNPGISQAQFDGVRQAWHDYTKPSPSMKDLCQFSERMVAGSLKRTLVTETKRYYDSSEEEIWRQYFENFTPCREARGPVALSLFRELKPRWVKKLTEAQRQVCVCRTCCNINFLLKALAKHKSLLQLPSLVDPPEPHPQPQPQPQLQHHPLIDDGDEDIHSPFSDPNHEFEHGAAAFSHQTTTSQHRRMALKLAVPMWWSYGATSHFKGRHDSEGGVLKHKLRDMVLADHVGLATCRAQQLTAAFNNKHTEPASQVGACKAHRDRARVMRRECLVLDEGLVKACYKQDEDADSFKASVLRLLGAGYACYTRLRQNFVASYTEIRAPDRLTFAGPMAGVTSIVKSGTGVSYGSSPSTSSPTPSSASGPSSTPSSTPSSNPAATTSQPSGPFWQPRTAWGSAVKQGVSNIVSKVFQS